MKDGNTVTEKNLVFDPYTGEPILRTITNEFGDPIYHYAYKGHWYYENMKPSYINYRYSFIGTINSFPLNSAEAAAHLQVGDKVLLTGTSPQLAWVSNITGSTITFIDEEGETPAGTYTGLRVVETIRKNLQSVSVGGIVSLDNLLGVPGFGGNAPVFAAFNGFMDNYTHDNVTDYIQGNDIEVETCEGNLLQINMFIAVDGALGTSNDKLLFVISQGDCIYEIDLTGLDLDASDIDEIRLYYYNDDKVLLSVGGTDHILDLDFIGGSEGKCAIALPCINNIGVLNATATTMHDEWDYHFEDAGDPFASVVGFDVTDNPWRAGVKGIWRMKDQYAYQVHRKQSTPTNIAKDGTFKSFVKFDWFNPVENMNPSWTRTNTVTLYSPYGYELENRDVLGLYSSALYGHDQAVVTAVAGNSSYYETAFDGFEDYVDTVNNYPRGHGHVYFNNFVGSQNLPLKTSKVTQPHSGRYCIGLTSSDELTIDMTSVAAVSGTAPSEPYFTPLVSKKYIIVFWAKCGNGVFPEVNMSGAGLQGSPQTTISHQAIEGWYRVETIFETTNTPNDIEFEFHFENKMGTHSPGYIDDFRIQPFKSAMKAYAYDNNTLWLMAELDDRNYATFYNYDEEGNLVQIKKETERGIMTIQTGRKNVRKVGM